MPPQARPRALANLDAAIAAAEAQQRRWAGVVAQLTAAGRSVRREEGMLQIATRKLAHLRESRAVLASGAPGKSQE